MTRTFGSSRLRLLLSLALAVAAGLGMTFPADHGCRSAVARGGELTADGASDHDLGHGSHRLPASECQCVGDVCGASAAIPLSVPVLCTASVTSVVAVPMVATNDRPVVYQPHVLPFANGPPSIL